MAKPDPCLIARDPVIPVADRPDDPVVREVSVACAIEADFSAPIVGVFEELEVRRITVRGVDVWGNASRRGLRLEETVLDCRLSPI
jgi:hypothetical protein